MKRLSLFNHEKRIATIERQLVWSWVALFVVGSAVLGLIYVVKFGHFP